MKEDLTQYRYSDAVIDRTFVVCGVKLLPFSLGKLILLEKIKSSVVQPEVVRNVPSFGDEMVEFFLAVIICGLNHSDGLKLLSDDRELEETFNQFCEHLQRDMASKKNWSILIESAKFKAYLKYYLDMPVYDTLHKQEGTPSGTDWKTNLVIVFKKLGVKEDDILNMSTKKLFYEWCSFAESEGGIKVMNAKEVNGNKIKVATITVTENK